MKLFWAYLRQQRWVLLAYLLCGGIFAVTFALYRLPLAAVLYPAALGLVLLGVFAAVDYGRVRRVHSRLQAVHTMAEAMLAELLPAQSVEAADLQAVIALLRQGVQAMEADLDGRYRDMVDYYTVWAHQIKTPIAAMRLTLQNEDSPLSRRLSAELSRVEQYVGMVLAFLRLDDDVSDYVFREYPLDTLVRQCVRRFSAEFIDRHIRLEYTPAEYTVVTDEKWFCFVLEQLLSNALKYTREGGCVRISLQGDTLCVADTGIGIAPEDLPRIFEKGYTGGNGRLDKKASGLGLYLCRRICQALGIRLTADSVVGQGTTLYLCLKQYALKPE